ncbi:RNA polymerase sigma factor [Candidatus Hydrogenedentota bacterium]
MRGFPIGKGPSAADELKRPGSTDAWTGAWPQSSEEFEGLVEAYLDRLLRYALRRLGNLRDAEDVVQEVFVRAFAERAKRKHISEVGPYLYRMVNNACTDLQRKRSEVSFEEVDANIIPYTGRTPLETVTMDEETTGAEELLRRLPGKQAEVIRLRVMEGLTLKEISIVVGCSVYTVGSRLRIGFEKLRKIVAKEARVGR